MNLILKALTITTDTKGKGHPMTCLCRQRGGRAIAQTYSQPQHCKGMGSRHHAPGCFTSGKDMVPIVQEAGWASGPAGCKQKISPPPRFDPQTIQLVGSCYNDCVILAAKILIGLEYYAKPYLKLHM